MFNRLACGNDLNILVNTVTPGNEDLIATGANDAGQSLSARLPSGPGIQYIQFLGVSSCQRSRFKTFGVI